MMIDFVFPSRVLFDLMLILNYILRDSIKHNLQAGKIKIDSTTKKREEREKTVARLEALLTFINENIRKHLHSNTDNGSNSKTGALDVNPDVTRDKTEALNKSLLGILYSVDVKDTVGTTGKIFVGKRSLHVRYFTHLCFSYLLY